MSKVLAVISFIDQHGRPVDPGFGGGIGAARPDNDLPPEFGGRPDNTLPRPPHTWPPQFPPGPTDPEWGVGGSGGGTLPIYLPARPDNDLPGLPPVAGQWPLPDPPPGTIWPPLPPGMPAGKAAILVAISGLGYRYAIIEIPEPK